MSEATGQGTADRLTLDDVFGVVVDSRTYKNILYLALAFPLGLLYFVALTVGLSLGMGLAVILVGFPLLLGVVLGSRPVAAFERQLANGLLAVDISAPDDVSPPDSERLWPTLASYLGAASTWKGLAFLYLKFWVGVLSFVLVVVAFSVTFAFVTAPLHYADPEITVGVGPWVIDTLPEAVLAVPFGLAFGLVSLHVMNAAAWVSGQLAKALLGGKADRQPEAGRDVSAETVEGDA